MTAKVERRHREQALCAMHPSVTADEIERSRNSAIRWVREGDDTILRNPYFDGMALSRVAQALADLEAATAHRCWQEGADAEFSQRERMRSRPTNPYPEEPT